MEAPRAPESLGRRPEVHWWRWAAAGVLVAFVVGSIGLAYVAYSNRARAFKPAPGPRVALQIVRVDDLVDPLALVAPVDLPADVSIESVIVLESGDIRERMAEAHRIEAGLIPR